MLRRFAQHSVRGVSAARWLITTLRVSVMQRPIGMNRASGLWVDKGASIDKAAKGALCILGIYTWYRYVEETKALEDRKDRYPKAPLMARKALEEGVSKTGIEAIRHLRHVTLQYLEDIGAAEPQKEFSELAFTIANSAHHAFETETEKAVASAYTDILSYFRSFTVADDPSQHLIFLLLLLKSTLQLSLESIIYYEMAMREKLARYAAFVNKVAKRGTILDLLSLSNILEEDLLDLAKKVGPEGIRILTQTRQQVMNIIENDRDVKSENRKEVDKLLLECADRLQELLDQVPVTGKCKLATDDGQPTNEQIEPGPNEQSTPNSTMRGAKDESHDTLREVKS